MRWTWTRRIGAAALGLCLLGAAPLGAQTVPNGDAQRQAALPKILSDEDLATYAQIFRLQDQARLGDADKLVGRLKDKRLVGHVLAQRYLGPHYRTPYRELAAWLTQYGDHPQAPRMYKLALKRLPPGTKLPPDPATARSARGGGVAIVPDEDDEATEFAEAPNPALDDRPANAAAASDEDDFPANAAAAAGPAGPTRLAQAGIGRAWEAGLAAWRHKRWAEAARHFEAVAGAPGNDSWRVAAGHFWAARTHHAAGNPQRYVHAMQLAAQHPRSFYGILARNLLGLDGGLSFQKPGLTVGEMQALAREPGVLRALALAELRQHDRADLELRAAAGRLQNSIQPLIALATRIGAPSATLELAMRLQRVEGVAVDAALYPLLPWQSQAGENGIDAALLHALIRQESGFRARALSRSGARGLMQLMPATGRFIARATGASLPSRDRLYDPALNLALGQAYVTHLFRDADIGPNLFRMVAAYNYGPGNLRRWERRADHADDPLLFIESIPARETRDFIERVLANMWIYRMRFGQRTPSLDALAAGEWPGYDPQASPDMAATAN
ncbi:MAG: lytic transglycosylase domain-containing protein [Rhodospirillales bacterium]